MSVRAAVIGCGAIAKEHLDYLSGAPNIDLVAVCDTSAITAEYFANLYDTKGFVDAETMIGAVNPDTIHVLTPPASHMALTKMALQAGAHVVCEKPLAMSSADLEHLLDEAERADRLIMESQNYRFNDEIRAAIAAADSGELGKLSRVEVEFALPVTSPGSRFVDPHLPSPVAGLAGGVVHDFLPHLVYLALLPLGFPGQPDQVTSRWRNVSGNELAGFDDLRAEAEFGDVVLSMRFTAFERPDRLLMRLCGSESTMTIELYNPQSVHQRSYGAGQLDSVVDKMVNGARLVAAGPRLLKSKVLQHGPLHGFPVMLDQWYSAIGGTGPVPVSVSDLRACAALSDAILEGTAKS